MAVEREFLKNYAIPLAFKLVGSFFTKKERERQRDLQLAQLKEDTRLVLEDLRYRTEYDINQRRREHAQIAGTRTTRVAAQGLDVKYGTAQSLSEQDDKALVEDIYQLRRNARLAAYGVTKTLERAEQSVTTARKSDARELFANFGALGATFYRQRAKDRVREEERKQLQLKLGGTDA